MHGNAFAPMPEFLIRLLARPEPPPPVPFKSRPSTDGDATQNRLRGLITAAAQAQEETAQRHHVLGCLCHSPHGTRWRNSPRGLQRCSKRDVLRRLPFRAAATRKQTHERQRNEAHRSFNADEVLRKAGFKEQSRTNGSVADTAEIDLAT